MKAFLDMVRRRPFGSSLTQAQIDGLSTVVSVCNVEGTVRPQTAYILATAFHETGSRMQPVRDGFASSDYEAIQIVTRLCEKRGRSNYAAIDRDTGESYYSRGFVPLTHKTNYKRAGERLDLDLVNNPDLVLHPEIGALILVRGMMQGWFTAYSLPDFVKSFTDVDFVNARRVVNRLDRAHDIAEYAKMFNSALLQED